MDQTQCWHPRLPRTRQQPGREHRAERVGIDLVIGRLIATETLDFVTLFLVRRVLTDPLMVNQPPCTVLAMKECTYQWR